MARTNNGDTTPSAQKAWNPFADTRLHGTGLARAHAVEISLLSQNLKTRFLIISRILTEDRKSCDAAFRHECNLIRG